MTNTELYRLAERTGHYLSAGKLKLVTAESCTGGGLAQCVTDIPGSSLWFECGFVTYSNDSKRRLLGVDASILENFGAVSEQTVRAMATGALSRCEADVAVAISGVAGPAGGTHDKPVGTVWLAWEWRGQACRTRKLLLKGDRLEIRTQAIEAALLGLDLFCNVLD